MRRLSICKRGRVWTPMLSRTVVNWCRISRWPQRCRCQAVKAAKSRCSHAKHMPRFHAWLTRARRPAKPHPSTPSSRPLTTPSSGTDHRLADLMLFVWHPPTTRFPSAILRVARWRHIPLTNSITVPVKRHRGSWDILDLVSGKLICFRTGVVLRDLRRRDFFSHLVLVRTLGPPSG